MPLGTDYYHIVFQNHNSGFLLVSGDIFKYTAEDTGQKDSLSSLQALPVLTLKDDAPVMLLVNLSNILVNGLGGKVSHLCPSSASLFSLNTENCTNYSVHIFSVQS